MLAVFCCDLVPIKDRHRANHQQTHQVPYPVFENFAIENHNARLIANNGIGIENLIVRRLPSLFSHTASFFWN